MTSGVGCELFIDGVRFADGQAGEDPAEPVAMSALSITWGRTTTVDQPDAATCEFDVADPLGGPRFSDTLRTGLSVVVNATATVTPDPTAPAFENGGFDDVTYGPPWTETRRNLVSDPRAVTGTTPWWVGNPNVISRVSGAAFGEQYAERLTITSANVMRGGFAVGAVTAGQRYTVRFAARGSVSRANWSVVIRGRANIVSGTGQTSVASAQTVDTAVREYEYTFTATASIADAAVVLVNAATGAAGEWFEITRAALEVDDTTGQGFFDGATVSPDPQYRYQWTATPNQSPSAQQRGTATPVAPPTVLAGATVAVIARGDAPSLPNVAQLSASANTVTAVFAPAPFSTLPEAWDDLPVTTAGDSWAVRGFVQTIPGALVTIAPALFTGPNDHAPTVLAGTTYAATGGWVEYSGSVPISTAGRFVGVAVRIVGIRPAWADLPSAQTWTGTPGTWADYALGAVDSLNVEPPTITTETVAVFAGRITDLDAQWDDATGGNLVHVTATDFTADLDNVNIGDDPWSVEPMGDRFARILSLSGLAVSSVIDDTVSPIPVSYQDVDNQAAAGLLKDLSQSVDGILWAAFHRTIGAYLRVEDPSNRTPLFTLDDSSGLVVVVPAADADDALTLSACDVLRDPIHWAQSVSDVSTRVAVTWLEQGVDDDGMPTTTERTVTVIDGTLEPDYGVRRISYSTLLQAESDATNVANRILNRTSLTGWRASGFTVDDADLDAADEATMIRLLDGTQRIGLPILVTDLPEWAPVPGGQLPIYLEGGTYRFEQGLWVLALDVTRAGAQGASVDWAGLDPSWAWADFSPTVSWVDLIGVSYTP